MSRPIVQSVMRNFNIFSFDNFWKSNGDKSYSSVCGGLVSIPLLAVIIILLVLKLIQMANYGIVMSSSQVNYSYQPPLSTFSTSQNDTAYAPFMIAFSVNIDSVSCPNSALPFEAFSVQARGAANSANRTTSKVPLNFESCSSDHFSMLPGKLGKLRQWTNNTLNCLSMNSYFHIGGSSTSNIYNSIQFRFSCPSTCAASTCGTVEFFTASATPNLQNSSFAYSYGLTRNKFYISSTPISSISYQIDSANMTSDNSILPFSVNTQTISTSLGNVVTDISNAPGDLNTYLTIQRSDKTTIYMRSYYKMFDLLAYMGGIVYGILIMLFFIKNFSKIEFELNFAAEYFRIADSKSITFRGYLKQLIYQILKYTPWKPDWNMAEERQESRQAVNKVLDVLYLNKRIAFLQEAISLIFQKHQLKCIHLLHSLNKRQIQSKINAHRFRDRLVYFLGKKYRHLGNEKIYQPVKFSENQNQNENQNDNQNDNYQYIQSEKIPADSKREFENSESVRKINEEIKMLEKSKPPNFHLSLAQKKISQRSDVSLAKKQSEGGIQLSVAQQMINSESLQQIKDQQQVKKLSLKELIKKKYPQEQRNGSQTQQAGNLIINEAENYYSELALAEQQRQIIVINNRNDNSFLKKELELIGKLTPEELNEDYLIGEIQGEVKQLMQEAEKKDGNQLTKKIYSRLDGWIKNYLKDTLHTIDDY